MNAANPTLGDLLRLPAATSIADSVWLNRLARHPAIRLVILTEQADAQLRDRLEHPGYSALASLMSHPAAQSLILSENLVLGDDPIYNWDTGSWITGDQLTGGEFGIGISNDEMLPALSRVLSAATNETIDAADLTIDEAVAILDSYERREATSERTDGNVRVESERVGSDPPDPCDEICEIACRCLTDRQGARTFTECVAQELRQRHYDGGRHPISPNADGPRPEVSYRLGENGYEPVMSRNIPGVPTSAPVVRGAPRPDISWWRGGRLWRIFELKFPGDGQTPMQENGEYRRIASDQGLDPADGLQQINVGEDCDCSTGRAKPGVC